MIETGDRSLALWSARSHENAIAGGFDVGTDRPYGGFMRMTKMRLLPVMAAFGLAVAGFCASSPARAEKPAPGKPQDAPDKPGKQGKPAAKDEAPLRKGHKADTAEHRAKLLSDLYAHLATAEDETRAHTVTEGIELLWVNSGSDTISLLLERSTKAMAEKKTDLALKFLDAVVDLAPDFAEGWNRRAYIFYTQNNTERAMGDLRRVLALDPNHYKALDGIAVIFKETGNKKAALKAYEELLRVNPFASGAKDAVQELRREVEGQGI